MSILRSVFSGNARIYSIDLSTSTSTGQPLETLVDTGRTIDIAELRRRTTYDIQVQGNVLLEDFRFLSETELDIQTNIVEVDSIKYRLKSKNRVGLQYKTFGYQYSCSRY